MLSIIIPTLNEQEYLPLLLLSLAKQQLAKQQDFGEKYEVIVADAGSIDKTVEIAKSFGCKVVKGGLPAKGRNEGAKNAKGDLLLFLDADVILPKDFLENFLKKFKTKKLDIASTAFLVIESGLAYRLGEMLFNLYFKINQYFFPCAGGFCLLVKKELHQKLGGFDELIKVGEDVIYARRAKKIAKFHFFWQPRVFVSARRIERDGKARSLLKYLSIDIHQIFLGPVKTDVFKYKFGNYKKNGSKDREILP